MDDDIVSRLRVSDEGDGNMLHEAADMLEFFFSQMQMHSPKMDGHHSYRFRGGWPMTHAKGNSPENAIRAAMSEVRRSKDEMSSTKTS